MNYTEFEQCLSAIKDVSIEWDTLKLKVSIRKNGYVLATIHTNTSQELFSLFAVTGSMVKEEYDVLINAIEDYARTPIKEQLDGLYYLRKIDSQTLHLNRESEEWERLGRYDYRLHGPFLFSETDINKLNGTYEEGDFLRIPLYDTRTFFNFAS